MPSRLRAFLLRFRRRLDRDFDQELDVHLSLLTEKFISQGMTPEEAAYAARRQFGGVALVKQERYESYGFRWIETLLQDMRLALRTLRKSPGFTITALAALALGIGANTGVFSIVDAVLLKPLKAPNAGRIVRFLAVYGNTATDTVGQSGYARWSNLTDAFEDVSAYRLELMNFTEVAQPEQIPVARVTASFFRLFGAPMLHGRPFTAEEDRPGEGHVVVLSYGLWTRRFANDPAAVGKTIILGGAPYVITGVFAPGFDSEQFDPTPDAWIPYQIDRSSPQQGDLCTVTGRLKPGVSVAAARERLKASDAESPHAHPNDNARSTVEPLREAMVSDLRPSLLLLTGAVSFVLLIACANIASLLLIRASGRKREIAIRASLGASRLRIVRQLLAESVVVSMAGGALGLMLGMAGIRAILTLYTGTSFTTGLDTAVSPIHIPRIGASASALAVDWRVAAFTIAVSVITGVLFGLIPAIQASRTDLSSALKESGRHSGMGLSQTRSRSVFVAGEMALAMVLLIGAALLIRTYVALRSVNPGFDKGHVLVTQMSLAGTRFEKTASLERLVSGGTERLRTLPGVSSVSAACCIPLETTWQMPLIVEGRPMKGWFHAFAGYTFISPNYFDVFRVPLLRGRSFTDRDRASAPNVVIINEALAKQLWAKGDPLKDRLLIGKGMGPKYDHDTPRQIVGIVGDIRDRGLNRPARPAVYIPIAQLPDPVSAASLQLLPMAWFVRASTRSHSLELAMQNELEQAGGGLPITPFRSMDEVESQSTARQNFNMLLMSIFSAAALLLAAIGIYGSVSYAVQQRTQELGIRLALGASAGAVRKMVVMQSMYLALIGVGAGIAAAFGLTRFMSGFLFGVKPWDPVVFTVVPLVLAVVALMAAWLPALRATRIDPVNALRCD